MEDNFNLQGLRSSKKRKVNSSAKGNRFQRKIAGLLNDRFSTKEFCPTPGSGAFATTHTLPAHLQIYGDLITPENFRFCIECKHGYNDEKITSLFNPKAKLFEFVSQAKRDAEAAGKDWMLIWQQNRSEIMCIVDPGVFNDLKLECFSHDLFIFYRFKDIIDSNITGSNYFFK